MAVAGIDIGSVYTKGVLLDGDEVLSCAVIPTGTDYEAAANEIMRILTLEQKGVSAITVEHVVTTGYGRRSVSCGDKVITELSAACYGAEWIRRNKKGVKGTGTIIDLGGQDTKVILLNDSGKMQDFLMNDKCAAGTGRFLEVMARVLEVKLEDLAVLSSRAKDPVTINSTCTVFAESEVISLLARGTKKEDIIAGIHAAIASRIINMVRQLGEKEPILFAGGGAKNGAVAQQLESRLGKKIHVPEHPQFLIALGAACSP